MFDTAVTIELVSMSAAEFAEWLPLSIDDYACDMVNNYGLTHGEAHQEAREVIGDSLPNGRETADTLLLSVQHHAITLGWIWCIKENERSWFVADIMIKAEHQRQGIGRLAFAALEQQLKRLGAEEIRLRVANSNVGAQRFYYEVGFVVTGINMNKQL